MIRETRSKFGITAVIAAAALFFGVTSANAASVMSLFTSGVANTISDDDAELLLDVSTQAGALPGVVDVGDVLFGAIGFNGVNGTQTGGFDDEITGLFATEVLSVAPTNPISCGGDPSCAAFTLGPIGSGGNALADLNAALVAGAGLIPLLDGSVPTGSWTTGTYTGTDASAFTGMEAGIWFLDPATDFAGTDNNSPDIATTFDTAAGSQAIIVGTSGFDGVDDFWFATGPTIFPSSAAGSGIGVGGFTIGGSFITQAWPGFFFSPFMTGLGTFDVTAVGNISDPATGPLVGLGIRSDATFNVFPTATTIPEPGTMILLGSGLLGVAGLSRRKKKA